MRIGVDLPPPPRAFRLGRVGLAVFLLLLAGGAYALTLSWAPFPGRPAHDVINALGLEGVPPVAWPFWCWLVRLMERAGLPVATAAGVFAAVCGALGVVQAGLIMTFVGYRLQNQPPPSNIRRQWQARGLAGLATGLYLMATIPYWLASTRSVAESFHLMWVWAAVWLFALHRKTGKSVWLFPLGVVAGTGLLEYPTWLLLFPVALLMVCMDLFRRNALASWRPHACLAGGMLAGMCVIPVYALWLWRTGQSLGIYATPSAALLDVLRTAGGTIARQQYGPGFILVLCCAVVPWLMLFAMSRRMPWFYEYDQILLRLVFVVGFFALLYNAPFAFWNLSGMRYLLVMPCVLLATAFGYTAGELWILGEVQHKDSDAPARRALCHIFAVLALLMPLGCFGALAWNAPVVNGRPARLLQDVHRVMLRDMEDVSIVFSSDVRDPLGYTPQDDLLHLEMLDRRLPVLFVPLARSSDPRLMKSLARQVTGGELLALLESGTFRSFVDRLLSRPQWIRRTAFLDLPELFRDYGRVVPDGLLYRLEPVGETLAPRPVLSRSEKTALAQLASESVSERNIIWPYLEMFSLQLSKTLNNVGVEEAKAGHLSNARDLWLTASQLCSNNASVELNLMSAARERGDHRELEERERAWAPLEEKIDGGLWLLSLRFGYLWKSEEWATSDRLWALSGLPAKDAVEGPLGAADAARREELDLLYLRFGLPPFSAMDCRMALSRDGRDTDALARLGWLAARENQLDRAKDYLKARLAAGAPALSVRFDEAVFARLSGDTPRALEILEELIRLSPDDARVWMGVLLWTPHRHERNQQALRMLTTQGASDVSIQLALARFYLTRGEWAAAQAELEAALRRDSGRPAIWEQLALTATIRGNTALAESARTQLFRLNPSHPWRVMETVRPLMRLRKWTEARETLDRALQTSRDSDLLHESVRCILAENINITNADARIDEALALQPFHPQYLCTRAELRWREKRLAEAARDARAALDLLPSSVPARLWLSRVELDRGYPRHVFTLLQPLKNSGQRLTPWERDFLRRMRKDLQKP